VLQCQSTHSFTRQTEEREREREGEAASLTLTLCFSISIAQSIFRSLLFPLFFSLSARPFCCPSNSQCIQKGSSRFACRMVNRAGGSGGEQGQSITTQDKSRNENCREINLNKHDMRTSSCESRQFLA
jgi:hypothetical protein